MIKEYEETSEEPEQTTPEKNKETLVDTQQELEPELERKEEEVPPLISTNQTEDLLVMQGLNEINPKATELEESNALALAIVPPRSVEDLKTLI
ncbi:putative clathrin assembly protein [Camellia lanceoleosa]|uniref:Clathrin assembly protein n=1 Tax=Camellia lanceoleosa TaxID=1840588 RepID=A0ACC0F8M7_9ERIC|nr:putative clathrin assembly protein [Camellia lanceoleosa]